MSLWQSNYYPYNGLGGKSLWKDTDVFREAAITFSKLGKYTPYPEGTIKLLSIALPVDVFKT